MEQDPQRTITLEAANDNAPAVSVEKVDAAVMRLARLLGRQIARSPDRQGPSRSHQRRQ